MIKTTTTQLNPKLLKPSPELLEIQNIMPIASDDRQRLENDIKLNGVRDAIKVYQNEDGEFLILGGMNRWDIETSCGIEVIPVDIYSGEPDEYKKLVRDDNLNRRHLTTAQKKSLIEYELERSPEKSNRQIAEETKTTHVTVAKVRKEKEEKGEIEKRETVISKDGAVRSSTQPERLPIAEPVKKQPVKKTIKCPHCGEEIEI